MRVEARIDRAQRDERPDQQRRADQQTSASATSLITSSDRALLWRNPVPERLLLSLSVGLRSGRDALSAGNSPKRMPVRQRHPRVNASTRQSMPHGRAVLADARNPAGADRQQSAHSDKAEDQPENAADQ